MVRRMDENGDSTPQVPAISPENHLENQVEEVILDLPLSENAPNRTQNHNKRIFQLWTHPDEENTTDNRESLKSSENTDFSVANSPMKFLTLNHPSTLDNKHAGPYPGLSMPVGLCWPYADGDFLKDRKEIHTVSCSTVKNNNGDSLSAPRWNLKYRNSNVEENVTDESDLSENEKMNDTLLSYFKTMDLNLKPETIENTEEPFTLEPSEMFVYADFLPAPFNTLDLHKFALSKCENWKATVGPPESSIEQLITRLLELERLQHMTIQKEKQRPQSTLCPQAFVERPSSSKAAASKTRQPKPPDTSNPQTSGTEKSRERRKNNCVSGKLEQNASKWNWNSGGKSKLSSRPALKCPSTTKQDDLKASKSSCQELPPKPATAPATQPPAKPVSTRCILPRSPMPVSPIPLTFPENQREEVKAPRNKKKVPRKSILLNKPLYIHKLSCLSPSFIKGKCSPADQK
uniref:protein FAM217A n=1 Tax=Jaculus jaculus TaxID=51337 RepID=UPI001E1B23AC|nr:protein FAM217A [Jaculus jaculus]